MLFFRELDMSRFAGALVVLDIDGTVTNDKSDVLEAMEAAKLGELAADADVYLCSNGRIQRTRAMAERYGVRSLDSMHRKPSRRVMERVERSGRRVVMIGDKALTDGLFAANIGAEFIPVKRLRHIDDGVFARFVYAVDDIASYAIRTFYPVLPALILLRPQQWLKNLLVFAPVFFAGDVLHTGYLCGAFWAAIVFSSAASAMYVLNDMRDLAQDRIHPTKSGRPLASGAVSLSTGWILASACVALAFLGCVLIPALFPVIALYIVGNLLYSYVLKHVAVIDIVLVAFFYILRVIAGGAATLVYVSPWILLCVFFGALFLVAGKRRAEFVHAHKRRVLESYTKESLDLILVSAATLAVTAYGLYSVLAARSPYVIYSTLLVIVVIFRALLRILRGDTDAEYPETMILRDKWSLAAGVAWLCFMAAVFYWHL